MRKLVALALTALLGLGTTGCIKEMILKGQIESTRKASTAIDTLHDYEVAKTIAFSGISQFEGMHYLAPDNEDALFMLTKSWTSATFAFIEDEMEQAEDTQGTESELYKYHQARTRAGYDRAIHYGVELLEQKSPGFEAARKNDESMKAWLQAFNDPEHDVPNLFWTGYAWIARVNAVKEDPELVSELFVGVAIMERVAELDGSYYYGSPHTILGSYHARTAMAELDDSKREFDKALEINGGKVLLTKFQLASKYYCMKGDKENYVKTLTEVVEAGDVMPEQRLSNTVAKRRAKRYLSEDRMSNVCGF